MTKFEEGDLVQLDAESVLFYKNLSYDEFGFSPDDYNWESPEKVLEIRTFDVDGMEAMYTLENFPLSFYEFELEYADMRRS
jgi:hypothetical protein